MVSGAAGLHIRRPVNLAKSHPTIDRKVNHMIDLAIQLFVQSHPVLQLARSFAESHPARILLHSHLCPNLFTNNTDRYFIRDQFSADRRIASPLSQAPFPLSSHVGNISRRNMRDLKFINDGFRLRPFSGPGEAHEHNIHALSLPVQLSTGLVRTYREKWICMPIYSPGNQ